MAPVESPRNHRRPQRGGGIERESNKPKPGADGDDFCAICDNGGAVACCEGGCQRSFHLADENSKICRLILGLDKEKAKMILADDKDFICKNCKYKQHQCFACGKLGSSDLSSEAEVFQCEVDDCGHFYHPKCAAELLYPDSEQAPLFEVHVAAGEKFTCPRHECIVCKGGEDKNDWDMQFAVCRRCPTTYHRKCLPSDIPFETKKGPNGYMQRAWDKWEGPDGRTIPCDRILIYCMKHDIKKRLQTPKLNHIIFPDAKKVRVPKILVGSTTEEDIPEEAELLEKTSPEPSESPLPVRTDENQCSCSSPIHSFAPVSLFRHPHPGTCGWLGD
ncbi:hypothetical protein BS78_08G064000 [Paspalum vaginatum]|nr:hypothetical protein BS78_08G064000 [Paspalum vaginatum]KAJ1265241.1 hypothetical protein BS78_08G064000 [Paspalum vaginatum]